MSYITHKSPTVMPPIALQRFEMPEGIKTEADLGAAMKAMAKADRHNNGYIRIADTPEHRAQTPASIKIRKLMSGRGYLTTKEVEELSGYSPSTVKSNLLALVKVGALDRRHHKASDSGRGFDYFTYGVATA